MGHGSAQIRKGGVIYKFTIEDPHLQGNIGEDT